MKRLLIACGGMWLIGWSLAGMAFLTDEIGVAIKSAGSLLYDGFFAMWLILIALTLFAFIFAGFLTIQTINAWIDGDDL